MSGNAEQRGVSWQSAPGAEPGVPRPGEPQGEQSAVEPSVRVEHVTGDDGGESGASSGTAAASPAVTPRCFTAIPCNNTHG